ncbi:MAG: toxin co-regulated pilus biosynthesis Q family protein [Alphaproteobacteria bacterium]|nr:toxin co-regulated pilus biosynthesis Q family protein [Alphaproteobacteria bacterium]
MFRKLCVFVLFTGFFVRAFGAEVLPEVVTSEVFYNTEHNVQDEEIVEVRPVVQQEKQKHVPAWPIAGSEADVDLVCEEGVCNQTEVYELNEDWSGGPSIDHGYQVPAGFDDECNGMAEMPLLHRELLEDDGGSVLSASRSPHKICDKNTDSYIVFSERAGFSSRGACDTNQANASEFETFNMVDESADSKAQTMPDQVRSWVVASGQTLREVLQAWCDKEGWDLVWTTSREYPIEASAVFKGRFIDVASALIRNFERATPVPYAKFYKGNRVIVVSTLEE